MLRFLISETVYYRLPLSISSGFPNKLYKPVFMYTPEWREALREQSAKPGHNDIFFDPKHSGLISRPPSLPRHPLSCTNFSYLLLIKEPNTIRLSSINATISDVLSPRNNSSPRFLKFAKVSSLVLQSATTDLSLASMSFSLTAAMQTSCREWRPILND